MKHVLAVVCVYEVVGIVTGRLPLITEVCGRHPSIGVVLIVAGAIHLAMEAERRAIPA